MSFWRLELPPNRLVWKQRGGWQYKTELHHRCRAGHLRYDPCVLHQPADVHHWDNCGLDFCMFSVLARRVYHEKNSLDPALSIICLLRLSAVTTDSMAQERKIVREHTR